VLQDLICAVGCPVDVHVCGSMGRRYQTVRLRHVG
jgi:hypothetical protein